MSETHRMVCILWLTKEKRTCGTETNRTYRDIPMCDEHRPSRIKFQMVKVERT
ncbi:hypothetical protein LCGC14_1435440 [marine sediment metagenome]|uniref:Uncharacterized protein n=1 Tax=marine sediment metagenome TaxID=412755 RepID=A0A0F9M2T7_9ZZZZ